MARNHLYSPKCVLRHLTGVQLYMWCPLPVVDTIALVIECVYMYPNILFMRLVGLDNILDMHFTWYIEKPGYSAHRHDSRYPRSTYPHASKQSFLY